MKTVKELLGNRELFFVKTGSTIKEVVDYMAGKNIGLVPVLNDESKLVGVFSERDLVRRVIAKGEDISSLIVDDIMTKELILGTMDESYEECLQKMKKARIRHIIVAENGELKGVLSIRDLLEVDLNIKAETIETLHNYIYST
ncbi:MAG: CBS domain-containing protein [Melioribacteraceae bacterium]|nr:CBS domain-containing protein [Melioribacteraceae bacterium]MCF8262973.1 CBS domain-containing protein [Melioribacteraceae bacterium]MCF8430594.1 CBS domain-containing protein [Melioribacteraceae bacterium]